MNCEKYLVLFSNCKIVNGASQATITDLLLNRIYTIPISMAVILSKYNRCKLSDVYKDFSQDDHSTLDEYFDFLISNELIHLTNSDIDCFTDLKNEWDIPSKISNCIIDLNSNMNISRKLILELDILNCKVLQIRIFDSIEIKRLEQFLIGFEDTTIHNIEILFPYDFIKNHMDGSIINFVDQYQRITNIIIYNSPKDDFLNSEKLNTPISYIATSVISKLSCGNISKNNFAINAIHYTESLHHNTCLNRKISIDVDGNIKNCPSMKESFGNIKDTTLEEAINKPGFKKYWNITKDEITKCKDCEFRHVCTDCRAYIDNPDDIYSAPLKCGYNPYTCEWEEWSTNPLKQKAIDYYGMREILTSENEI